MSRPLRAVVVGCGRFGAGGWPSAGHSLSHAAALERHPDVELVGLSDPNPDRRRAASETWARPIHDDVAALCRDTRPDIVTIASSTVSHGEAARAVLEAAPPRCLLIEKPLAATLAEAEEIVQLAERVGTALAVNYSRRFAPAYRRLVEALGKRGRLGAPQAMLVTYGKGLANNGSHAIDLARMLFGEPIEAHGHPVSWALPGPGPDDPTFEAELTFAGGVRARLQPFDERIGTVFEVDIFAERGRVRGVVGGRTLEYFDRVVDEVAAGYAHYVRDEHRTEAGVLDDVLDRAVDALVSHVHRGTPLPCSGADGLAAMRWVARIRGGANDRTE